MLAKFCPRLATREQIAKTSRTPTDNQKEVQRKSDAEEHAHQKCKGARDNVLRIPKGTLLEVAADGRMAEEDHEGGLHERGVDNKAEGRAAERGNAEKPLSPQIAQRRRQDTGKGTERTAGSVIAAEGKMTAWIGLAQ